MAKGKGQKVNRRDLASIFGVSLPTVDSWVAQGMPFDQEGGRGREWVFDTADVARWRMDRAADEAGGKDSVDDAALTRRRKMAEVKMAELELLKQMGQVAPLDQIERAWSRMFAEINCNLRGAFVARVVTQIVGETDEKRVKAVLLAEIDSTLESLADMDISEDQGEADDSPGAGDDD